MSELVIQLVTHKSPEYTEMVNLRRKVLRVPLKMDFTEEELAAESSQFHVAAFLDGRMVGCLILVPINNKTLKMRQVAVDDSMQGQGVGTRLVSYSEELAIKKGFCCIELHARKTAVKFYIDLAYQILGDEFTEVGLPHLKMEKNWCA